MRISITLVLLFVLIRTGTAQYLELGSFLGASNYGGELNTESPLLPEEYKPAFGLFARYNFSRGFAAKASLIKGQVSGNDANARSETLRMRNLSFRSDIVELSLQAEVNLLPYAIREKKTSAPYLFAGISGFYFNPQAQMRGNWYDLQPLGTEGQGSEQLSSNPKYSRYQVAFPMGIGVKLNLNNRVNFGLEFGVRKTFTDYLDDVSGAYPDIFSLMKDDPIAASLSFRSPEVAGHNMPNPIGETRGDPTNNDWFFFGGLTISVNMTDKYGLDFDERYAIFKQP